MKVWHFEENYRNTKEIASLALSISAMPYYAGAAAELVIPKQPSAAGPKPTLVEFTTAEGEVEFVVDRATRFGRSRSVAILVRTRAQVSQICRLLPNARQLKETLASWANVPGVSVGTLHSGKGLEFDVVLLPFLSADFFPNPIAVEADGLTDATACDGRLLYVGVTRAKTELLLTHFGARTSLLPSDLSLYVILKR